MSNMEDFVIENGMLVDYVGTGGEVEIPEGIKELDRFWCRHEPETKITKLTLPSTLEYILPYFGCETFLSSLTSLVINGPAKITGDDFSECKKLKTVVIGKNVKHIKKNAFKGCKELQEVTFESSKASIKVDCFSFPEKTKLIYPDPAEKETTLKDNISLKDATKLMTIKKMPDGYKIVNPDIKRIETEIVGRGADCHEIGKFKEYAGEHVLHIPSYIDGIPVTHVSSLLIPKNTVVFCPGKLFSKLTRETKIATSKEWLRHQSLFSEEMRAEIIKFIKKYKQDIFNTLSGSESLAFYHSLFANIKISGNDITSLLNLPYVSSEVKAYLLEQSKLNPPKNTLSLDVPKKTVTEMKKTWTFQKIKLSSSGDEFYSITRYKGNDATVTVPAMIGKLPVKQLDGLIFDSNCHVKELVFEPNPELVLNCNLQNAVHLADSNGFIIIELNGHVYLTNYIGKQRTVCVPKHVTDVLFYAFREDLYGETLIIPEGVISAHLSFSKYNDFLREVHLPASVNELTVFLSQHRNKDFKIYAPAGSYAETYAKENNIPFVAE